MAYRIICVAGIGYTKCIAGIGYVMEPNPSGITGSWFEEQCDRCDKHIRVTGVGDVPFEILGMIMHQ